MITASQAVAALWRGAGLPENALGQLSLTGREPVLPSSFAVDRAAQASLAASGLAAALLWELRSGTRQNVSVDIRHAAAEFLSDRLLRVDGQVPSDPWDPIAGLYPTADGWVRLHTNFPHHRAGVVALLGCADDRPSVAAALLGWNAEAFETAAAEAGMCVTALRDFAAWDASPQGQAIPNSPVQIEQIGEAPAESFLLPLDSRPLDGVRVLDLTRIIAGPVGARTLAAHGADVLAITGPHLPFIPTLVIDTGRGKRQASLDLRHAIGQAALAGLVRETDVFVQGYRPGGLAALGFGPDRLAVLRPGIVAASLNAYGDTGPWAGRRGFDSLVQTASGFNDAEQAAAGDSKPRPLPCQALDHASGALLAFGIAAALYRRATVGGSWHVRVSLAGTARWLRSLGRISDGFAGTVPDLSDRLDMVPSGFGMLSAVRHAAHMSETPAHWMLPSVPLGTHPASWDTGRIGG